jgi:RNA polymerase sigma factor (sigma-70 family)
VYAGTTPTGQRSLRDGRDYPERCNPTPAVGPRKQAGKAPRRGDRRYPRSCKPKRSRPPLTAEQQRLATRYLPLARSLAARLAGDAPCSWDDFEAAACLALVEAAQSFDATRQCDFGVYARPHILGALYDLRRELYMSGCRIKRAGARIPEFVPLDRGLEERHRIVDSQPEMPFERRVESRDLIERWVRILPRRHADVIRHVYLDGLSLQQAACLVGCSASLMSRLHQEAIGMLVAEIGRIS